MPATPASHALSKGRGQRRAVLLFGRTRRVVQIVCYQQLVRDIKVELYQC